MPWHVQGADAMMGSDTSQLHSVRDMCKLADSSRLTQLIKTLKGLLESGGDTAASSSSSGADHQQRDYELIVESATMAAELVTEMSRVHKFIRDRYAARFPELDSVVFAPVDYARVVDRIGNASDVTSVELSDLLPAATVMVVSVAATTSAVGNQLPAAQLDAVIDACKVMDRLEKCRTTIVGYVESRMSHIAPNLSALVGTAIAAKLMTLAGGLVALSQMPACNLQVLGAQTKRKALAGFSALTAKPHQGFIFECDVVRRAPSEFQVKAARNVAGKCALAARIDSFDEDKSGSQGVAFRDDIEKKIEKWCEPPPQKAPKPLTAPDDKPRKKRGGKRVRKLKEKFMMTELRKQQNRMAFGVAESESAQHLGSKGLGMLGQDGSGKLRVAQADNKHILKKQKMKAYGGSSGATSGISSSLAFTPVQGIELVDPQHRAAMVAAANSSYFGAISFAKPKPEAKLEPRT
eukprot:TRINITY_DN572_c0_g2_i2.p1 TRINITY_DN572_c0_g2~~TRINITY_DN572_c0_g2_i2.p1  ORF type:complete len:465 (-),score=195.66 TRINITY_DN572_c0_g2_i2:58-1452(-)